MTTPKHLKIRYNVRFQFENVLLYWHIDYTFSTIKIVSRNSWRQIVKLLQNITTILTTLLTQNKKSHFLSLWKLLSFLFLVSFLKICFPNDVCNQAINASTPHILLQSIKMFVKSNYSIRLYWFCVVILFSISANDLRLPRIPIPDFIHYIVCPIFILQKEPVISLFNVECQTRELLVPFA